MKYFILSALSFSILLLPALAFASSHTTTGGTTLFTVFGVLDRLFNLLIPIAGTLALLAFFWGLAITLFGVGGDKSDDAKKKGKDIMIYGIIAIFLIVGIFGIVKLLQTTFSIDTSARMSVPPLDNPYGN